MSDQEFSVRELLDHAIDKWWVVVLIAVMGGVIGWASHFLLPPVYESTATITMTMDFFKLSQWEPTQYTQYAEDYAFNSAEP
jgi:LPS O-antigen subunit length determinant protein (WzzB/FepE family)